MTNYLRAAFARVTGMFTKHRADHDLRAELESHIEMETAELVRRGIDPAEARRQAMMASGGIAQAEEAVRDRRGIPWLESIAGDIKYAVRALRHSPAFSIVVILTLALGIGANTAIFSVVRGVLLKPLPNREGDRLVYLRHSADGPANENLQFSVPEVRDLRAGAPSFSAIAEYSPWFSTLQSDEGASRLTLGLVTGNFFEVMGLSPILGRLTSAADDGKGAAPVLILTHEFWMRRFGGDSSIVGKQLRLDAGPVTVIGVLQPAPFFPTRVDIMTNMVVSPHHVGALMANDRVHRMTEVLARLAPGATLAKARAEVIATDARMQEANRESYDAASHVRIAVIPFKSALGERASATIWLLMAAAAFVLIISAANVANLTLMRGVRREQEIVVRAALGAGVARLRRFLLVENLVLTLTGAAIGVLLAVGGVGLLTSLVQRFSARASEISLDRTVLGFALAVSVILGVILSLIAGLPREGSFLSISSGARRITASLSRHRLQRSLVVAQIAVSVVLLAGAGLLTRTLLELSDVNTGLRTESILTMPISLLNPARMDQAMEIENRARYMQMQREIAALPGVISVGLGSTMPLRTSDFNFPIKADGKPLAAGEAQPQAELRTASPEYFRAAGIPLVKGREFQSTDVRESAPVVIINQRLAEQFFPDEDPLGKRLAFTGEILKFAPVHGEWRTIVGVVGNTQDGGLDAKPRGVLFSPFAQEFAIFGGLVIRTDSNPAALAKTATQIVRRIVPTTPVEDVLTISEIKDQSIAPRRLNAILVSSFGLLAVLIAAVGIAGVLAFSVSARTNEIGIRMSFGADSWQVQRMILGEGGTLLALGLVIGVVIAYFAAQIMSGMLFGVGPRDPTTFVGVALMMAVIGIAACWIPALRASRIDPAITMRS